MRGEMSLPEKLIDQTVKSLIKGVDTIFALANPLDFKIIFERFDRALDKYRVKDVDTTK
ncbi:MAG: hypothetical protein ACYS1A_20215 [Planctomycetota bacterium]|jgi:hypothetical protein